MSKVPSTEHIDIARSKTDQVQRDLEVASAELGLTHGALERQLPPEVKHGDVAEVLPAGFLPSAATSEVARRTSRAK